MFPHHMSEHGVIRFHLMVMPPLESLSCSLKVSFSPNRNSRLVCNTTLLRWFSSWSGNSQLVFRRIPALIWHRIIAYFWKTYHNIAAQCRNGKRSAPGVAPLTQVNLRMSIPRSFWRKRLFGLILPSKIMWRHTASDLGMRLTFISELVHNIC